MCVCVRWEFQFDLRVAQRWLVKRLLFYIFFWPVTEFRVELRELHLLFFWLSERPPFPLPLSFHLPPTRRGDEVCLPLSPRRQTLEASHALLPMLLSDSGMIRHSAGGKSNGVTIKHSPPEKKIEYRMNVTQQTLKSPFLSLLFFTLVSWWLQSCLWERSQESEYVFGLANKFPVEWAMKVEALFVRTYPYSFTHYFTQNSKLVWKYFWLVFFPEVLPKVL